MKKFIFVYIFIISSIFSFGETWKQENEERARVIENDIEELQEKILILKKIKSKIVTPGYYDKLLEKKSRPKIGIALSGGGAKGAAHIGVLKVLEENNIPIDYISGTSIGSIVGAMYASGYSIEEMEDVVYSLNWDELFKDTPQRDFKTLEDKIEFEKYFLSIAIDDDYNLKFPKGVLRGEAMYLTLKKILWRAEGIDDFNDLPIPFRAVSTNLQTGKVNSVSNGSLALAVFKSMAIPTALDPIKDDGGYYVDGGLSRNLPVQDVIDMGADIVIAVDISADATQITDDSNLIQIIDKMSTYQGIKSTNDQKLLSDVLIVPDVKQHGTLDFTNLDKLVEEGAIATQKKMDILKNISYPNEPKRRKLDPNNRYDVTKINIKNNKILTSEKVENLRPSSKDGTFGSNEFNLWMERIYGLPYVDRVFYEVKDDELYLNVNENRTNQLRAGLNYNTDTGVTLGVLTSTSSFGEVVNNTVLGADISEYPRLFLKRFKKYSYGNTKLLGMGTLELDYTPLHIYEGSDKITTLESRNLSLGYSVVTSFYEKYVIGFGVDYNMVKTSYKEGDKRFDPYLDEEQYIRPSIMLYLDTRNKMYFADHGTLGYTVLESGNSVSNSDIDYRQNYYYIEHHQKVTERLTLAMMSAGGSTSGSRITANETFKLGGLRNDRDNKSYSFYGMNQMRNFTDKFILLSGGARYRMSERLYLVGRYNIATFNDYSLEGETTSDIWDEYKYGYGGGVGWDTLIGPMEFILSNDVDDSGILFSAFVGYDF